MSFVRKEKDGAAATRLGNAFAPILVDPVEDGGVADMVSKDPAPGATAMLIIDMINDLDFEGGTAMADAALDAAIKAGALRDAAIARGVPVVYVNDNYGMWHADRGRIVDHCLRRESNGRAIVERLRPRDDDFFVIKPRFSGFYATTLPVLLPELGASRLILTGIATDICVLFTAGDAHMRDYALWVPCDCTVSSSAQRRDWALDIMRKSMGAETRASDAMALDAWLDAGA